MSSLSTMSSNTSTVFTPSASSGPTHPAKTPNTSPAPVLNSGSNGSPLLDYLNQPALDDGPAYGRFCDQPSAAASKDAYSRIPFFAVKAARAVDDFDFIMLGD